MRARIWRVPASASATPRSSVCRASDPVWTRRTSWTLLAERGLRFVFIEGGGVTVSRFLQAGCLDRLQVTVAPLILGSGRPSFTLPEIDTIDGGLRPRSRHFVLGSDILFDCALRD